MVEQRDSKKNLFYIIVLILTLVTMIIGAAFAYYSLVASQKEEGTVLYTGKLEINYVDGVYIRNPSLLPMHNVGYNTYNNVYRNRFSIVSSGTLDQTLSIDIDISKNEFSDGTLKYAVYNTSGSEVKRGNVPQSGKANLADGIFLASDGTATYTIIIWWDDTTNYDQAGEMGKNISGKITAYAKQLKY